MCSPDADKNILMTSPQKIAFFNLTKTQSETLLINEIYVLILKSMQSLVHVMPLLFHITNCPSGGGVRMPKVKKILDEYFKASKIELGQHLNGLFSTDIIVVISIIIITVDVVVAVL